MTAVYTNPVWPRDFPDPCLLHHQDVFYAYATETRGKHGFQALKSSDLIHWEDAGVVFRPPWAKEHFWAPEVAERNGRFYLTYSARNPRTGLHDIGIATADHPLGPFEQQGILVISTAAQKGVLDGSIYFERGKAWLVYAEEGVRRIVIRPLSADLLRAEEPVKELLRPDRPWERGNTEAPTLIKRNNRYHLFYSAGWFESSKRQASYCIAHAVSRNLLGPYQKTTVLAQTLPDRLYSPGHQCLLTLPGGETWMAYHGWDSRQEPRYGSNPLGRTLRIDLLLWEGRRGDVPRLKGPSVTPQRVPRIP